MAARPAPVAARGEARALRASRAPSRAPRRRARRGGAVSRADPGDGVPSSAHDSIAPDMFGASPGPRSSALHRAARRGDLERVRRLLETRAHDVNEADANGSTALMWACQFGRDDVVEALLRRGADARARNKFNWSALEYASTSSLAGDVLFVLLPWYFTGVVSRRRTSQTETHESNALAIDADASSLRTRETVAAAALSGAYGALLGDWSRYVEHDDDDDVDLIRQRDDVTKGRRTDAPFARSGTKARSPARLRAVAANAAARYVSSAATSFRDARDALSKRSSCCSGAFHSGGVAIAGCTRKPLGLYAGQRYEIRALFWRNAATDARVSVSSADASASALRPSPDFVLCAELSNPTWTPWGSIETEVNVAELRSVRDELVWAAGTASVFAAFFVASGALLRGGAVSVASVPSDSMAPGVRRGDALLVDRRRASVRAVAAGDVVLFAPPPRLASVILETRGSAPKSGELFVKRVVAVAGDELEIVRGAVFRNGSRETPYVTGTPVGVTAAEANAAEAKADEAIASTAFENVENENGRPVTCDVCKTASYDLRPTRVPPGNVFVLGDNRGGSVDGHVWGYLPLENVRGVVRFRVGPLSRFGALEKTPVPF